MLFRSEKVMVSIEKREVILKTIPFSVEKLDFSPNTKGNHPYYRLLCPDWVNILPLTSNGQAVLIRQERAGSLSSVLETPGGAVDNHEKNDPTLAAARELEEETGYTASRYLSLASMNPNPALHDNYVHFFLGLDCDINPNRKHFPDPGEEIEIVLVPIEELEELVQLGRINHALSALCIKLAAKYFSAN